MALKLTKQLDRERSIRVFKYAVSLRWRFVEHKMCIFASLWTLTFATGFRSFPLYSLAVGRSYVFYALKPSRGPRTRPSYPTPALYFLTAHGVVIKHREIRAPELRSCFHEEKMMIYTTHETWLSQREEKKIESRFMRSTRRRTTRCSISKLLFFLFVFGWYFCIAMEKNVISWKLMHEWKFAIRPLACSRTWKILLIICQDDGSSKGKCSYPKLYIVVTCKLWL